MRFLIRSATTHHVPRQSKQPSDPLPQAKSHQRRCIEITTSERGDYAVSTARKKQILLIFLEEL